MIAWTKLGLTYGAFIITYGLWDTWAWWILDIRALFRNGLLNCSSTRAKVSVNSFGLPCCYLINMFCFLFPSYDNFFIRPNLFWFPFCKSLYPDTYWGLKMSQLHYYLFFAPFTFRFVYFRCLVVGRALWSLYGPLSIFLIRSWNLHFH